MTPQGEEEDVLRMSADVGREPEGSLQMTERMRDVGRGSESQGRGRLGRETGSPAFKKGMRERHRE